MELNRDDIIKALECCSSEETEKFNCEVCPYRDKCCNVGLLRDALSLIKELTEENESWQKSLITQKENADKAYYELACEVENLRAENERLRAELEQRPPKLVITKLPKKESKNV